MTQAPAFDLEAWINFIDHGPVCRDCADEGQPQAQPDSRLRSVERFDVGYGRYARRCEHHHQERLRNGFRQRLVQVVYLD